jgi:hypothetical protein
MTETERKVELPRFRGRLAGWSVVVDDHLPFEVDGREIFESGVPPRRKPSARSAMLPPLGSRLCSPDPVAQASNNALACTPCDGTRPSRDHTPSG